MYIYLLWNSLVDFWSYVFVLLHVGRSSETNVVINVVYWTDSLLGIFPWQKPFVPHRSNKSQPCSLFAQSPSCFLGENNILSSVAVDLCSVISSRSVHLGKIPGTDRRSQISLSPIHDPDLLWNVKKNKFVKLSRLITVRTAPHNGLLWTP